jgi:hypothetical protein
MFINLYSELGESTARRHYEFMQAICRDSLTLTLQFGFAYAEKMPLDSAIKILSNTKEDGSPGQHQRRETYCEYKITGRIMASFPEIRLSRLHRVVDSWKAEKSRE